MCDDPTLAKVSNQTFAFPKPIGLVPDFSPVKATVLGFRNQPVEKTIDALGKLVGADMLQCVNGGIYKDMTTEQVTEMSRQSDVLMIADHLQAWQYQDLFSDVQCPVMLIDPPLVFHSYQAACRQMFRDLGNIVLPGETRDRVIQSITALRGKNWLEQSKMLMVCDPDDKHPMRGDIQARAQLIHQLTGVRVISVPVTRLKIMASQVTDQQAKQVWEHWRENLFDPIDPALSEEHLNDCARLYVAMRQLVDEHQANAIAVQDFEPFLFQKTAMPNLAHTALRSEGITTAEEGDIAMLITQLLLSAVHQQQAMMANVYLAYRDQWEKNKAHGEYDPDDEATDFAQCVADQTAVLCHYGTAGIVPPNMTDDKRYRVIETLPCWNGQSMTFAIPKLGDVLMGRLDESNQQLHIYPGKITQTFDDPDGGWCRGRWYVNMPGMDHFVDHAFSAHYAICMQPQPQALATLCQTLGLDFCLHKG
ncbi:MAG: hypothetical protein CMJ19_10915 [Phycisphaeraceae bacterium]|nr:hypothetical protein [Phycisphaeraceae bacterium]